MPTDHPLIKPAKKPTVLIVGAGIGGLTLATLLHKADVPFQLYDRMTEIKPLGSALSLGVNVIPLMQQLGLYEEILSLSKRPKSVDNYSEDLQLQFSMSFQPSDEMSGFTGGILSRSLFHQLLFRQIPSDRIHMNKRVLSMQQNEHGVRLQFSDGSSADGDILVGADGAYSAVRQSLYQSLKRKDQLPEIDDGALPFSCVCLVGQTKPMDPEKFPELQDPACHFSIVVGDDKPYSWSTLTTKGNIYCWSVALNLDKESSKDHDSFRNTEWGPEAATAMCKDVRDFALPGGRGLGRKMTLGDLIDQTPLISKVMLEEKVFTTWHAGRTVLLGDACHKIHPASGAGAINAMQDAVALANWISILDTTTAEDIEMAFREYKEERYPAAVASFNAGQALSRLRGTSFKARFVRFLTRNMPAWMYRIAVKSMVANRPQVSFLPQIEDKGLEPPKYQPSLQKTLAIRKAREEAAAASASNTLETVKEQEPSMK
ncbi:hypothetical protein BCR41DRAFT_390721 [Lobosporangium transversale]|uniref:FAD-binding domain-containing protein n=1 Tax=Lobosporangium transversale TaxID=64571 RepID=A0A1Y2G5V2_9FUNG|nr:hypothetical protein BCR41DRAFT_390721 [Lobosporangium transversale]ORY96061.1 hypothetical protein BCR41DRAFT_390721 [Lobosporangium transversale]|eukprot:XP_021875488.1 hypothetical protein BCR41DRAFT_390721 [Lobosporangium transversale]